MVNISADAFAASSDQDRRSRTLKPKNKNSPEDCSSAVTKYIESTSGFQLNHVASPDFVTDYELAKVFIIKFFNEDNTHKSIKYSVWASTPLGHRKLDAAYRERRKWKAFVQSSSFFQRVNGADNFVVAEMLGHVDYENDADYWQQDRNGQFPVKWHIIKDVPDSRFRHIVLENNDNKPVTHSRDAQE